MRLREISLVIILQIISKKNNSNLCQGNSFEKQKQKKIFKKMLIIFIYLVVCSLNGDCLHIGVFCLEKTPKIMTTPCKIV